MSFTYYRVLTIDHTKCGSNPSVDFPVLFSATASWLKTTSHTGGRITNLVIQPKGNTIDLVPADLIFSSDIKGLNLLSWEIESYEPISGTINVWIKIPSVSNTVDTIFYALYNDSVT